MVGARSRMLTVGALAVILTAAVLPITAGPVHAADAVAKFDWEMPARTGLDANHDGVIDARTTQSAIARPTAGWQVNFDACASEPSTGASIDTYRWWVDTDGKGINPETDFVKEVQGNCHFFYHFPEEGVYKVALEVLDSAGVVAYVTRDVTVQDFLVVALGDSFGSGQGNPDIPIPDDLFRATENALVRLNARLGELGTIETDYSATERKVSAVRSRYGDLVDAIAHELDVCNLFSPNYNFGACFGSAATAVDNAKENLLTALRDLGHEAWIFTLGLIEESLDELMVTWDAAVETARTAVTDAQEAFDAAKADAAPVWQNKRCNRSSIAGEAKAALALEQADPHTSVTLVHLACSGAEIFTGLIGPYAGVEVPAGASDLPPQVDKAVVLVGGREVDAVLLSIGGNDAGFGEIVKACIVQEPCDNWDVQLQAAVEDQLDQLCELTSFFDADCVERSSRLIERYGGAHPDTARQIFDDGAAALPGAYRDLANALADAFPAVAADPGRVYISEYPNALEDDNGSICTSSEDGPFNMLPGITLNEGLWLRDTVTRGINRLVANAAADHGWTLVDGIFDGFAGHGYCADHGWFRRLQDSFRMQGTMEGVVHPTAPGHVVYGEEYLAKFQGDLYAPDDGGTPDLDAPRSPNPNYSSSGGGGGGGGTIPLPAIARFEWTMDPDGTAHFDGCGSTGSLVPIIRYTWPVPWVFRDGGWVSTNESGAPWVSSSCDDFTYRFTEAGQYRVVLDVLDGTGHGAYVDHYLQVSDAAPPSVVGVPDRAPYPGGWYSSAVTIDWQATDPAPSSGTPTDPQDTAASGEGSVVYTSDPSCDSAGNCATGTLKISIDKRSPTVIGVPDRKPNAVGWYSGNVTIDWYATDPAPSSGAPNDPPNSVASTEGNGVGYTSAPSCDPVGHCTTGAVKLSIDKTAPLVACQSPAPTFQLGATGAMVSAAVTDALSGPVDATVSAAANTSSVGPKTLPLIGQDLAGNSSTVSCPYIVAYVFGGFLSPVDEGGVLNVVKAGRAIPLKWRLTDASGAPIAGLTTATVTVLSLACSTGTSDDLIEETVAGGSGLQNLGDGYYQLNWKTPSSYAGSCKTMRLDLGEGLVHKALFKFTK